jgi:uncharacterized protein (UPF0548 family)
MPSLFKPSAAARFRVLTKKSEQEYTYPEVGATANLIHSPASVSSSYNIDHTRVQLGSGEVIFERATAELRRWKQFRLGWLEAFPDDTPLRSGETILVVARACGLWWTNAARIVYVIDEQQDGVSRFGFAYGTLPGHVESGEERFLIEWDRATDVVQFDIIAFSRPRHILVRMNRRRARAMQKRFAAEAGVAMQRAMGW